MKASGLLSIAGEQPVGESRDAGDVGEVGEVCPDFVGIHRPDVAAGRRMLIATCVTLVTRKIEEFTCQPISLCVGPFTI